MSEDDLPRPIRKFMTEAEAAEWLTANGYVIKRRTLQVRRISGTLSYCKNGRRTLYTEQDLRDFLASQKVETCQEKSSSNLVDNGSVASQGGMDFTITAEPQGANVARKLAQQQSKKLKSG